MRAMLFPTAAGLLSGLHPVVTVRCLSKSQTTASVSHRITSPRSTTPSTPLRASAAAPAWAWPYRTASFRNTLATSASKARPAVVQPSASLCPPPTRVRDYRLLVTEKKTSGRNQLAHKHEQLPRAHDRAICLLFYL